MTLYEKIMALYPSLESTDFIDLIRLQDDLDGKGAYIAFWNHPEFPQPTEEQLDGVK